MPYLIIQRKPVFLHATQYEMLRDKVLAGQTPEFRIDSAIAGRRDQRQAERLMCKFLEAQYKENPSCFQTEWVEFDLKGQDATANVWDLLYDYGCFHGCSYVCDLRPQDQHSLSDLLGDSFAFPMGKVFAFKHNVKSRGFLNGFLLGRNRSVTVVINADRVSRLRGNLERFEVLTDHIDMRCDGSLTLVPSILRTDPTGD
jgi:hypothetical protein